MIVLFTDFGVAGPYLGQMKAVLHVGAPATSIFDLMNDAPAFDPQSSAYLLASLIAPFSKESVFICVVDPGVGSVRDGGCLLADGRWFVGPDNGLLEIVARRADTIRWWRLPTPPKTASASFHGRDVFAPVAAKLATGVEAGSLGDEMPFPHRSGWPDDLQRIVYVDGYGNAVTGLRAQTVDVTRHLIVNGHKLTHARVFSEVPAGDAFWYENSNGLIEIAVNQGRADQKLGICCGAQLEILHEK